MKIYFKIASETDYSKKRDDDGDEYLIDGVFFGFGLSFEYLNLK
jgi:hypothetical protein